MNLIAPPPPPPPPARPTPVGVQLLLVPCHLPDTATEPGAKLLLGYFVVVQGTRTVTWTDVQRVVNEHKPRQKVVQAQARIRCVAPGSRLPSSAARAGLQHAARAGSVAPAAAGCCCSAGGGCGCVACCC